MLTGGETPPYLDQYVANYHYGAKVAGLLILPPAWVPPFVALPAWMFDLWERSDGCLKLDACKRRGIDLDEVYRQVSNDMKFSIIARSSVVGESLEDHGRFKSVPIPRGASLDTLLAAINEVYSNFQAIRGPQPGIGICVQRFIDDGIAGLRVGVPTEYFFDHAKLEPAQKAAVEAVIARLEDLGADVREVHLPHSDLAKEANTLTLLAEALSYHRLDMASERWTDYGANTRQIIGQAALFSAADYVQAQRFRRWYARKAAEVMNEVDVLVTPTSPGPAPLASEQGDPTRRLTQPSFTGPFNLLGYPALALPAGFSEDGLPLSAQIVGAPFAEATLLRAARAYQSTTYWHLQVPPIVGAYEAG